MFQVQTQICVYASKALFRFGHPHCSSRLKWKPPSENSIDFKLVLRFPSSKSNPSQPEFHAKPFFGLHVYCGDDRGQPRYELYDTLFMEDDEWERWVSISCLLSTLCLIAS